METIENAIKYTQDELDVAYELERLNREHQEKWEEKIARYEERLLELRRAKAVLKENGF